MKGATIGPLLIIRDIFYEIVVYDQGELRLTDRFEAEYDVISVILRLVVYFLLVVRLICQHYFNAGLAFI